MRRPDRKVPAFFFYILCFPDLCYLYYAMFRNKGINFRSAKNFGGSFTTRNINEGSTQLIKTWEPETPNYFLNLSSSTHSLVRNLLPVADSVTWSGGGSVVTTGREDPRGGTNAISIEDDNAAGSEYAVSDVVSYIASEGVMMKLWMKKDSSASGYAQIHLIVGGSINLCSFLINPATGYVVPKHSSPVVSVTEINGWWFLEWSYSGTAGSTIGIRIYPNLGSNSSSANASATGAVTVYAPNIWYTNSTSSLQTSVDTVAYLSGDQLRIENRGDGEGDLVLLEGAHTNLFRYSADMSSGAYWARVASMITSSYATAPDGTETASIFHITGAAGRFWQTITSSYFPNNSKARVSFWARTEGTTEYARIRLNKKDLAFSWGDDEAIGPTWKRFSGVLDVGSGSANVTIGLYNGTDAVYPRSILLWGFQAQVESNDRGDSYIPTEATTASFSQEQLLFPEGSYPQEFLDKGFEITYYPYRSSADTLAQATAVYHEYIAGFSAAGTDGGITFRCNGTTGTDIRVYVNGVVVMITDPVTYSANQKLTIKALPSEGKLILSGFTTGNGTYTYNGPWTFYGGNFTVGRNTGGTIRGAAGRYGMMISPSTPRIGSAVTVSSWNGGESSNTPATLFDNPQPVKSDQPAPSQTSINKAIIKEPVRKSVEVKPSFNLRSPRSFGGGFVNTKINEGISRLSTTYVSGSV